MDQPLAAATGATPPRPAGGRTLHRFANPGRFLRATGKLMPMLWGAALVVAADAFARTVVAPLELPVGALLALIGGPYFLALLWRRVA